MRSKKEIEESIKYNNAVSVFNTLHYYNEFAKQGKLPKSMVEERLRIVEGAEEVLKEPHKGKEVLKQVLKEGKFAKVLTKEVEKELNVALNEYWNGPMFR